MTKDGPLALQGGGRSEPSPSLRITTQDQPRTTGHSQARAVCFVVSLQRQQPPTQVAAENHLQEGYAYILLHPGMPMVFYDHMCACATLWQQSSHPLLSRVQAQVQRWSAQTKPVEAAEEPGGQDAAAGRACLHPAASGPLHRRPDSTAQAPRHHLQLQGDPGIVPIIALALARMLTKLLLPSRWIFWRPASPCMWRSLRAGCACWLAQRCCSSSQLRQGCAGPAEDGAYQVVPCKAEQADPASGRPLQAGACGARLCGLVAGQPVSVLHQSVTTPQDQQCCTSIRGRQELHGSISKHAQLRGVHPPWVHLNRFGSPATVACAGA